ncbi:MAG: hypothetical protein D6731_11985 [Planctomycetota bacterium]|nr:MAG: hypothetical protein D6731_11985 [Planctomycetota bacterium]
MSTFAVLQQSERLSRERAAAIMAAQSMLDEISAHARQNPVNYPADTIAAYNDTGFDVFFGSYGAGGTNQGVLGRGVEASDDAVVPLAQSTAKAANFAEVSAGVAAKTLRASSDDTLFPQSRAGLSPTIKAQAGFVTVKALPPPRDKLLDVDVVVAWRSADGDHRIAYSALVGPLQ